MEIQLDANGNCSEANREGACSAAKEFVGFQKFQGKHVSVMLTVPKLPSVNANGNSHVGKVITRHTAKPAPAPDGSAEVESSSEPYV
jgi:hypothetical protein